MLRFSISDVGFDRSDGELEIGTRPRDSSWGDRCSPHSKLMVVHRIGFI